MTELLLEPWSWPFMRWALVCCLVLAGIHAYLGFHVVRRGVLFVDLALAQAAALGAAVGVVLGFDHDTAGGWALSLAFALGAAGLLAALRSRRVHAEAVIAIFYALATAATFVVLEHSPHGMDEVKHLFVGQILTVAPRDVGLTALLYAAAGVVLRAAHPALLAATEARAATRRSTDLVFFGVFAVVVTSSVGLVGVLLVFGLLVLPAVAGLLFPRSPGGGLVVGWAFAGTGCLVGLHLAYLGDQPAAPMIVLSLGALLVAVALLGRRR